MSKHSSSKEGRGKTLSTQNFLQNKLMVSHVADTRSGFASGTGDQVESIRHSNLNFCVFLAAMPGLCLLALCWTPRKPAGVFCSLKYYNVPVTESVFKSHF